MRVDPGYTLTRSTTSAAKVPFRLMAPHRIESSSYFARDTPVRVYKPANGHTAVCLTFARGNVYWQIMETDWTDAPIIRHPTSKVTLAGPEVRPLHDRRQHPHGRAPPGRERATGSSTRCATSCRTRRCSRSPKAFSRSGSRLPPVAKIGMFGAGYVGLVTGACFAELGHEVVIRDVIPERIERLRAGEVPIYEPGLDLVLERNKERIHFTLDVAEAVDGADFLYVAVGTPPTESGDADLAAVWSVIDELPSDLRESSGRRDEEHGARRHRRARARAPRLARAAERRLRLQSGVPRRGKRGRGLHEPRPDRHRRVRRGGRRPRRRAPSARSRPSSCAPTCRRPSS